MTTFTLDADNNITAHDATPAAQDNVVAFATEKELTKLSADWPITRFVEVWNAFAGVPPFGDRRHIAAGWSTLGIMVSLAGFRSGPLSLPVMPV